MMGILLHTEYSFLYSSYYTVNFDEHIVKGPSRVFSNEILYNPQTL